MSETDEIWYAGENEMDDEDRLKFFDEMKTSKDMKLRITVPEYDDETFELSKVFRYIARYKHTIQWVTFTTDWEPNITLDYKNAKVSFGVGDSQDSGASNYMDKNYKERIMSVVPLLISPETITKVCVHLHHTDGSLLDEHVMQFLEDEGPPVTLVVCNLWSANHYSGCFKELKTVLNKPRLARIVIDKGMEEYMYYCDRCPIGLRDYEKELKDFLKEHKEKYSEGYHPEKYSEESAFRTRLIEKYLIREPKTYVGDSIEYDDVFNNFHDIVIIEPVHEPICTHCTRACEYMSKPS